MKKESIVKLAGIVPFLVFLLAGRIWTFTFEVKISILAGVTMFGCAALLLEPQRKAKVTHYLMLGAAVVFTVALFCIQNFFA